MERGYIKIYRKILDSGIIQNPHAFQIFGYLLLTAAYKPIKIDVRGELIELNSGQLVTGRKELSEKLKISEQCVRTALKYLEKNKILTIKSTKRFSLISIINWDTYQSKNEESNQQTNQELTKSQPSANQELTTKQEFKNLSIKEINNLNIYSSEPKNRSEQEIELIPEEIFIEFPVIGQNAGIHGVTKREIEQWKELYPAIDIEQELRKMKGYFLGNPQKRKTRRGINRSIHHWLANAQDRYKQQAPCQSPKTFAELEEEHESKRKEEFIRRMKEKYGEK